jgi:hypothetical protein
METYAQGLANDRKFWFKAARNWTYIARLTRLEGNLDMSRVYLAYARDARLMYAAENGGIK